MHFLFSIQTLTTLLLILTSTVSSHDGHSGHENAPNAKFISLPLFTVFDGKAVATNVTVGSNKDTVSLLIYTNAPTVWINPACPEFSENSAEVAPASCKSSTTYDTAKSGTAPDRNMTSTTEQTEYSPLYDGTNGIRKIDDHDGMIYRNLWEDAFMIGDAKVDLQFGVASAPRDLQYGEFSLLPGEEGGSERPIDVLAREGKIGSRTFGFQVPVGEKKGALTLGGYDRKKYTCDLVQRPLYIKRAHVEGLTDYPADWFQTPLTGIGLTFPNNTTQTFSSSSSGSSASGFNITLSSELIYNILPLDIFHNLGTAYPNSTFHSNPTNSDLSLYSAPCSAPPGSVDFHFGNATIHIANQDFLEKDPSGTCWLTIATRKNQSPQLSSAFFRSTYMVFDIDKGDLWLDQAADCGEDVRGIVNAKKDKAHLELAVRDFEDGCECKREGNEIVRPGQSDPTVVAPPRATGTEQYAPENTSGARRSIGGISAESLVLVVGFAVVVGLQG